MTTHAQTDALAAAKHHLAEERAALARCEANGWTNDADVARRELAHYTALVARLEALTPHGA